MENRRCRSRRCRSSWSDRVNDYAVRRRHRCWREASRRQRCDRACLCQIDVALSHSELHVLRRAVMRFALARELSEGSDLCVTQDRCVSTRICCEADTALCPGWFHFNKNFFRLCPPPNPCPAPLSYQ